MIAIGRLLGLGQLWIVATSILLLVVGCVWWTQRQDVSLVAEREIPEHLQVASIGRVDLTVENRGSSTTPTAQFADQFTDQYGNNIGSQSDHQARDVPDEAQRYARFALAPLAPSDRARAAYRVPTHRRGRFELGPLVGTIGDPFGVARRTWIAATSQEVIVHPRIVELMAIPELSGSGVDTDSRDVAGRPDTGGEFHTLRDYTASDDLRHVHWKSTARRGRLMVRQDESRRRAPVTVMLDTRAVAHNEASFERAVEAAASIVTALARSNRPFEVITTSGDPLGQSGRRYLGSVLDELAVIEPHGANRMVPALRGTKVEVLVAVVGELRDADYAAIELMVRRTGGRSGGLALVLCHSQPRSKLVVGTKRLLIDVSAPADASVSPLAQRWNEAVMAWQRDATHPYSPAPL